MTSQLQTAIIERFLSKDQMTNFIERYNFHKKSRTGRGMLYKPSASDITLYNNYNNKVYTLDEVVQRMGVKSKSTAINRFFTISTLDKRGTL